MSATWLFNWLSPSGQRARLTVLIYHRVLAEPDPLFPGGLDVQRFQAQVNWLKAWFNVLPLDEAVERLRSGSLPERAAAITFDDGYADNCTLALPILSRAGLSATFFVATGFLNGGRMWNDTVIDVLRNVEGPTLDLSSLNLGVYPVQTIEARRQSLEQLLIKLKYHEQPIRERLVSDIATITNVPLSSSLMMTTEQVRVLANAKMIVGAHTVSHPILSCTTEQDARTEMIEGKRQLEAITGNKIRLFAYPNGKPGTDYNSVHVRLAREVGFSAAVSTGWGTATKDGDPFQIPRFAPWDNSAWRYALRLARNMRHPVSAVH